MSIYAQSTIGTTSNLITFNNFGIYPTYRIVSRRPQQRQIRELDIPVPFESGISDFETLLGKTAYIIEGIMYPGGESDYDAGLRALRKLASLDISQNDVLTDEGYVPYVFNEFNTTKQIFMKVLYVDVPENTRKGLVQPFRLVCKIKDPTIYGGTLNQVDTRQAAFGVASGSAAFPFGYSIAYGASTTSVSVDANNQGDIAVYPVSINIHGPVNSPQITNTTTGEYIRVNTNLATTANELVIAYDKDSLRVEADGVSVLSSVTTASTWFKIPPGSNIFQLSGTSVSNDAYATVSYRSGFGL